MPSGADLGKDSGEPFSQNGLFMVDRSDILKLMGSVSGDLIDNVP
jgi:hypothetical protein